MLDAQIRVLDGSDSVAIDLGGAEGDAIGVDGLLGGDVLAGLGTLTIDYDEGVLLLDR